MVDISNVKKSDTMQTMYLSMTPYCSTLAYILKSNNVSDVVRMYALSKENRNSDMSEKIYWSERIKQAFHVCFVSLRGLHRIETMFNTDDLFNMLVRAIKTDADVKLYYERLLPTNDGCDLDIVE